MSLSWLFSILSVLSTHFFTMFTMFISRFAFIEFKCRKDANMARNRLKDNCIDGREVSIEFVPPLTLDRYSYGRWESNQNGEPTSTLIVRNLSYFILTEDLNKLFPNAKDVHLPKHLNTGCPKGYVQRDGFKCLPV